MAALARGFSIAKFFPAQQAGGIPALRALAGPFPQARFCPYRRHRRSQCRRQWLSEPNVIAVGGSWLCPLADIKAGNRGKITDLARRAMQ